MEHENIHTPVEQDIQSRDEELQVQDSQIFEADQDQYDQLAQSTSEYDSSAEKESFFVRTRLGQLALKIATDPIVALGVAGSGLNTFANTHGAPTVLNTTMAVASTAAATWRAIDIANKHLNEREQAELQR
ncbi:hypothetical protein KI440_03165 [Candidatus Saccharibacteria bacterium TM7i]|nr:hypothetical protein KI440_03165 [Candidatus Saccharibacteria bacterium TM7i]